MDDTTFLRKGWGCVNLMIFNAVSASIGRLKASVEVVLQRYFQRAEKEQNFNDLVDKRLEIRDRAVGFQFLFWSREVVVFSLEEDARGQGRVDESSEEKRGEYNRGRRSGIGSS